jgi:SnoaL-like domain
MTMRSQGPRLMILGCSLLLGGFVLGALASRRIVVSPKSNNLQDYVRDKGDAPAAVRAAVLQSLREFQAGYSRRDPERLNDFMQTLFPKDADTRVLGTDVNEWRNGYSSVARLVLTDWLSWGDLHLAVDDAVVDSSADAAWLATSGAVIWPRYSRSMRFAAVLTRRDDQWLFRQIVFQWDERPVGFSDLTSREALSHVHLR